MKINQLVAVNFCSQQKPQKLQNLTTGCCYLMQITAKSKMMMIMMQYTNFVVKAYKCKY